MLVNSAQATELLLNESVVALPTETVYGLAGVIESPKAIEKIFSTKERPSFDPLIVHVKDVEQAKSLVAKWNQPMDLLAKKFWPGPLTFVTDKKEIVSDVISAGLPTVGIRCPNHPDFLDVLKKIGKPLAAPSANRFTKTSPTKAEHVIKEFSGKIPVVDGGDCLIGIESTICQIQIEEGQISLKILRQGILPPEDLVKTLEEHNYKVNVEITNTTVAPGQMKTHYQPAKPMALIHDNKSGWEQKLLEKFSLSSINDCVELTLPESPQMAARIIYSELHKLGEASSIGKAIICHWNTRWNSNPWLAIYDRLQKASSLKIGSL